jgi:23S rRNA pseudouridine2605 synthase
MTDDKPAHRGRKFKPKRLKTSLPRPEAEHDALPPKGAERIAKVMARAGLASRREAEAWIAAGRVSVNGATINSPALNVKPSDRISVDGKPLPQRERTRVFLFHKPRGLVTTSADTHGRPTIFGALPKGLPRLISVGRLDLNTEGLLLLTNDGGLARALELPATGWLRRYRVRAFGEVTQHKLDELKNGITVDGVNYGAIEAALDRVQGSNVWITFAMREGKNREIRNVLRALGLQVNRLIRVSFGPFQLGELPDGAVEEVKTRTLRDQLGPRLAAQARADFSSEIVEREEPRAPISPRHPEARDRDGGRTSKSDGPKRHSKQAVQRGGRPSFPPPLASRATAGWGAPKRESAKAGEGRLRRPPQDDGSKTPRRPPRDDGSKAKPRWPSQDDRSKAAPRRDDRKPKWRRPYHGKRDR